MHNTNALLTTHANIKKAHAKLANNVNKRLTLSNKVQIKNNDSIIIEKTQIKSFNQVHMQNNIFDYDKCKKSYKKLAYNMLIELVHSSKTKNKELYNNVFIELVHTSKAKHEEQCNNVHIELVHTSKAKHKELFNNVLIELISTSKAKHKEIFNNVLVELVYTNKARHKELFNKVLIELLSTKNAGHQDSSANINEACAHDTKCETDNANSLLHNHILYYFNKIKKIEKALSEHN